MAISMQDIQDLREKTGFGVMDVKRALDEANGDMASAEKILQERGAQVAAKKADRATTAGLILSYIHGGGKIGVLIEVSCETDFVAKNEEFGVFVHDLALQITSMNPASIEELLEQPFIKEPSKTIQQLLHEQVGKIGENLNIRRFTRYELGQ